MREKPDDQYDDAETARRRDEVIRRMANTPPQHRATRGPIRKKAKATGARRLAKPAARRGKSAP